MAKSILVGTAAYAVAGMIPGIFGLSGNLKRAIYLGVAALAGIASGFAKKGLMVAGTVLALGLVSSFFGGSSGISAAWNGGTSQGAFSW